MRPNRLFFLTASLVCFFYLAQAQTVKLSVNNDSTQMTISGTSTLHDWTSEVNTVNGYVELSEKWLKKGKAKKGAVIPAVNLVIPVESIISPRGATMDKKTYKALKSEENPDIIFDLNDCPVANVTEGGFKVDAIGDLTIAGVTKSVNFPVEGIITSSDEITFSGSYAINMVEYGMEPPSAMFGQIETGEEVVINFKLVVER